MRKGVVSVPGGRFVDDGHLRYYVSCGGKKEEKKRAKLVKGLEKDLSALYSIGFGVEPEHGLTGEIQSKMFSEAADVLLKQLKQLRLEEKEMKRKRKEEKAEKKAAKKKMMMMMMTTMEDDDSESSCSSAPECCSAIMGLKSPETLMPRKEASNSDSVRNLVIDEKQTGPMNKIEVCMGGKCKRSGAMQLLEEIDKKVGIEGAVVGCKCMGKCGDGPNVRVLKKDGDEEETLKQGRNPLYMGVGLEDVGAIVSNFLVEKKDLALSSA